MRSPVRALAVLALGGCLATGATIPATQPASRPSERFFITEGIGFEVINEKLPVGINAKQAAKLFVKDGKGNLARNWKKHLPVAASKPAPNARPMPDSPQFRAMLSVPKNTDPRAYVAKFSKKHLIIRIIKPAGDYLWHHYRDNLATVRVLRNAALDKIFDLPGLTKLYAASYKGISQGDTAAHMIKVLGQPDAIRETQSMDFYFAEYAQGTIEIAILNGRVFEIRHLIRPPKAQAPSP